MGSVVLGLSVFTESSDRPCHKLHILSVFCWWFSFAMPPKMFTLFLEKDKLSCLYFCKAVIYSVDKNLETVIFNLVNIGIGLF